ncbi:MAG TPA: response regulator [Myxococcota bacterium]|jgi:CheY-like chemotaxis protein
MQSTAAERPLILLAEDDIDVQAALIEFLELSGYDVLAVSNGSDMLDALATTAAASERDVDLIITDVRMPGFNGLSIAEELRADGWKQPIIIISAFGDDVIRERVRRMDDIEFFSKPLDPQRLERALAIRLSM